jgi:hypothetical protein
LGLKEEAPHALSRGAFQSDPQVWDAVRQGNITLIHSAPTGEKMFELVIASEAKQSIATTTA